MIKRIKALVEKLNNASDAYYNTGNTIMSDKEFDDMLEELRSLEHATRFVISNSPTQRVGYEVKSKLEKVKHNHPMLSLDKTKSVEDVVKFLGEYDSVCMAKMDGLTCSLRYVDGKLVSAETRGNGEIGEDILHCAKTIRNIPLEINYRNEVIIDGEVIITYNDFNKINASLPDDQKYKNPRNLASGSIRQLDSSVAANRCMKFIAWKLIKGFDSNSFFDRWRFMNSLGFDVVTMIQIPHQLINKDRVEHAIIIIKEDAKKDGYPIDGCVFGYDDIAYGESLGATGHHLKSQLAFKFYDELYPTKLQYIDWTMGKTGILTPTAVFESVEIDGTDVSRASLHNISIIKNIGLTNGCTVNVFKANQIIPQIDSCEDDGHGKIEIPATCPVCGGATAINKDNESEVLICTNPNCSGKLLAKFVHFVSRKCMNIEGLSETSLEKFISLGYLHSFKDIYSLKNHHEDLVRLDGFGQKSVEKLMLAIEKSRNVRIENFIAALGINGIGLSASKTIAGHFDNKWDYVLDAVYCDYDFTQLDDFGEVMANNFTTYFKEHFVDICALAEEMNFATPNNKSVISTTFNGKIMCVTGKLNYFTRDSINEKITSIGAKAVGSVSKKCDYLITNEASSSSKYKKAVELGVPIITEDEFLKMLEG